VDEAGVGICSEQIAHGFELFYRADRARSRNRGGAGLGLPIVKWIVDAHGGHVHVASEQGAGSHFTIELPLAPAIEPEPALQFLQPALPHS